MKTKNIFRLLTFLFLVSNLSAQETAAIKVKEIGIGIYNLNNISLQYRWGTEKKLFRISGILGSIATSGNSNVSIGTDTNTVSAMKNKTKTPIDLNFGLNFSIIKFKTITEKFRFIYGPLMGVGFTHNNNERITTYENTSSNPQAPNTIEVISSSNTIQPFVGVILGGAYKINNSFFIYAEIGPNLYYAFSKSNQETIRTSTTYTEVEDVDSEDHSIGISNLSNSGAMLSFVYRINK